MASRKYLMACLCLVTALLGVWGWLACGLLQPPARPPSFAEVRAGYIQSDGILRDRHGAVIHEVRVDPLGRRLGWVSLEDMAPSLLTAVVTSEDKRFYEHSGVDWPALVRSGLENLFFRQRRGASTITMQVAAVLDNSIRPVKGRRTVRQKWEQARYALALEMTWSKKELLEAYLNLISYRGELQGISAAARGLFDKTPEGLSRGESLLIASLIRAPNAGSATVLKRARQLNGATGFGVKEEELESIRSRNLAVPYHIRPAAALAPHVARQLLHPGVTGASCTLDAALQSQAQQFLRGYLRELRTENVSDGAILIADNATGEILAYVGNGGADSSALFIDGVQARRQAGSTLKPFLYALAFDMHILTAASLLSDAPLDIPTERGVYRPGNYDHSFRGLVSARIALASSLNVPAVRVLELTGTDRFAATLRTLGFAMPEDGEFYGHSLALGTLDITLHELVSAYRTLANGGRKGDLTLIPRKREERREQVFSREASFLTADILSDREARSATFGLENPLSTRFWSSAKTGTSKDMRDNWCVGFTDRYTVGVWVGNFSGEAMWNVSGVTGAVAVWHELVTSLHRNRTNKGRPDPPPGLVLRAPQTAGNRLAGKEWFIAGTEPLAIEPNLYRKALPRIIYPPSDVVIALDPDIPGPSQRVIFEASGGRNATTWMLNGQLIGEGDLHLWKPLRGKHLLELVDRDRRALDHVTFTVR